MVVWKEIPPEVMAKALRLRDEAFRDFVNRAEAGLANLPVDK